ncbi:MAG: hypothetical protein AB9903_25070 [Vulcanimicrobiota bacterium]
MPETPRKEDPRGEPRWNPITRLDEIALAVDSQIDALFDMYENLYESRDTPYMLDDALIDRAIELYTEVLDDAWVFEEQLERWSREKLTKAQRSEVERLTEQMMIYRKVCHEALKLAEELKKGTIDRILRINDDGTAMLVVMKKTALLN